MPPLFALQDDVRLNFRQLKHTDVIISAGSPRKNYCLRLFLMQDIYRSKYYARAPNKALKGTALEDKDDLLHVQLQFTILESASISYPD